MTKAQYEYLTGLQYQNQSLSRQVEAYKSGSAYQTLNAQLRTAERKLDRQKHSYEAELAKAHAETVNVRNIWFQVFEDIEKAHQKELDEKDRQIAELKKQLYKAQHERDEARDKVTAQRHELYEVKTELEEEKGKNQKLTAQLNRDFENSSKPSSLSPNHKKIPNNRTKTGRKPGAQPGHPGHGRKRQEPTAIEILPPPQEVLDDPDFKKTKKTIVKQMVRLRVLLDVTEYRAAVYHNSKTGEYAHAAFPEGVVNDVNYDGSVKAFLFLLNSVCGTSFCKACEFVSNVTGGKLNLSTGMACILIKEFSGKTEPYRKETFAKLLTAPVLHTDNTNARVNGDQNYVFGCAAPDGDALFFAREKKGHSGVEDTPVELTNAILVHDHETTFYNYGSDHQECLVHVLRYLKDSMENEPERTWSKDMHALIQEMIHYRKSLGVDEELNTAKVEGFESRYRKILQTADQEYTDVPPSDYYRDGYNLFRRMKEYEHNHLLFLHNKNVPYDNNLSERLLRSYKRIQRQAVTLRSFEYLKNRCQNMGTLFKIRHDQPERLYDSVVEIFEGNTPSI